ncbi:polysaccharide deacetylase [Mycobacterium sp. GA-1285]|nr:polysaccharide deacetylase [Mycobacterium sp. GA-1285]
MAKSARRAVVETVAWVKCVAGVPAYSRHRRHRGKIMVLMYHGIEAQELSPPCWHVISAVRLRRQLRYVARRFQVLPIETALERLRQGALPARAAVLTFDDGTRNLLVHAAPILRELQLPAAVFLTTGVIGTRETLWPDRLWLAFARSGRHQIDLTDLGLGMRSLVDTAERGATYADAVKRLKDLDDDMRIREFEKIVAELGPADTDPGPFQMLSWDEARDLTRDSLVTLHPHSVTHPILSRCDDDKVESEIIQSCAALQRFTGEPPKVFAYPNGRAQDFDERARTVLQKAGVTWSLSTMTGLADRESDPLALPRIGIGSDLSFSRFRLLVSGAELP